MDYSGKAIVYCRKLGWSAQSVYKPWNTYSRRTVDLWDGIDVLALDGKPGCLGIQATGGDDVAKHIRKLRLVVCEWPEKLAEKCAKKTGREWEQVSPEHPLLQFLAAENRLQIWAFRKVKLKRGGKAIRWRPRGVLLSYASLTSFEEPSPKSLEFELPEPAPRAREATSST